MSSDTKSVRKKRRAAESDIRAAIIQSENAIIRSDSPSRQLKHPPDSSVEVDVASLLIWCNDTLQDVLLELGRAVDEASEEIGDLADTLSEGEIDTAARKTLRVDDLVAGKLLGDCLSRQFGSIDYRLVQYERRKKEIEDLLEALERRWQNAPTTSNLHNGAAAAPEGAAASENHSTRSVRSRNAM
jgi:hypothetical protein